MYIIGKGIRMIGSAFAEMVNRNNYLLTFLFHGLFRDEAEVRKNAVDPQQGITVELFREFVEYCLDHKIAFVSPDDLMRGLKTGGRYAMITFDDGYFSNYLSLPVLNEFRIPATVYVSTNHVKKNTAFWWDVIFRERMKRGGTPEKIGEEQASLKTLRHDQIEVYIKEQFGPRSLVPACDIDRPLTVHELKKLSDEPVIAIGNHTADHAILTNYSREGIWEQISSAQKDIRAIIGKNAAIISYPNGNYNDTVIGEAVKAGLNAGITTIARKNYLPLVPGTGYMMRLGRHVLWGGRDISRQCRSIASFRLLPQPGGHY